MALEFGLFLGAVLICMLYSRPLYKDNILYGIAESILIGANAGYMLVLGIKTILNNAVIPIQKGSLILLIPIVLGFATYLQLSKKTRPYARIPLSVLIGVGLGLTIRRSLLSYLVNYITASFRPLIGVTPIVAINNFLIMAGVFTTIAYFIMSREHIGRYSTITRIGRLFLMVSFGAYMGQQLMTRESILAGVIERVLVGFGLISPA